MCFFHQTCGKLQSIVNVQLPCLIVNHLSITLFSWLCKKWPGMEHLTNWMDLVHHTDFFHGGKVTFEGTWIWIGWIVDFQWKPRFIPKEWTLCQMHNGFQNVGLTLKWWIVSRGHKEKTTTNRWQPTSLTHLLVMWLKQCHQTSPSHHHFYRWYVYHSQMGGLWHCFTHIIAIDMSIHRHVLQYHLTIIRYVFFP